MENVLIYTGMGVLLAGTLVALVAGVKGWLLERKHVDKASMMKRIAKPLRVFYILIVVGFAIVGAGIALALNN